MNKTAPLKSRFGKAFRIKLAGMPSFTCCNSFSYTSASTQTSERSTIS